VAVAYYFDTDPALDIEVDARESEVAHSVHSARGLAFSEASRHGRGVRGDDVRPEIICEGPDAICEGPPRQALQTATKLGCKNPTGSVEL
jgi:hypothetical protein